jgi:hypothetical protein
VKVTVPVGLVPPTSFASAWMVSPYFAAAGTAVVFNVGLKLTGTVWRGSPQVPRKALLLASPL